MRFGKTALIGTFLLFSNILPAIAEEEQAQLQDMVKLELEKGASELTWLGKKVAGEHNGTVDITSGHIEIRNSIVTAGEFEISMSTISNKDLESPEWKAKLENHLKSDDFFNVSSFPTGTFKITGSDGNVEAESNQVTIKGELTIKGITMPVEIPATITKDGDTYTAEGKVAIDRTKWDIRYNSGKFFDPGNLGDKLIYDTIDIGVKIVAKKA